MADPAPAPYGYKVDGTPRAKPGRKTGSRLKTVPVNGAPAYVPRHPPEPYTYEWGDRSALDAMPGVQVDRKSIIARAEKLRADAGGRVALTPEVSAAAPAAEAEPSNLRAREYFVRIIGRARPKARPRFFKTKGGKVGTYTPGETAEWESEMRRQMVENSPRVLLDGPIEIEVWFFLPRPLTLPKKVKWHKKKPDVDNLKKSVMDVARGLYYKDDSQVVDAHQHKRYCAPDEAPYVTIRIKELEE